MASEASTMATNPRVSINPRASSCMRLSLEVGRPGDGGYEARAQRNVFELRVRRRNDVLREERTDATRGSSPRRDRRLHIGERSPHDDRDERIAGDLVANESDAGGLT